MCQYDKEAGIPRMDNEQEISLNGKTGLEP